MANYYQMRKLKRQLSLDKAPLIALIMKNIYLNGGIMVTGSRWIACLVSCLALTGCAANDLVLKRQSETEAKVEHLIQSSRKGDQRANELAGQIQAQDDQAKVVAAQIKRLEDNHP